MKNIPTVRIKAPNDPENFVVINAEDFDETKHERFDMPGRARGRPALVRSDAVAAEQTDGE